MKAIMKNVTIDNENEELVNFAKTIDFTGLFNHIKTFTGIDCNFYQPEITTRKGKVYISFMSDDITAQTGVFAMTLKRCYLYSSSSGNGVFSDKVADEPCYYVYVQIRYEHKEGGSNGVNVVFATYRKSQGWRFINVG